jgi:RNA polymerase sigma-70 factor, ECF subfamily
MIPASLRRPAQPDLQAQTVLLRWLPDVRARNGIGQRRNAPGVIDCIRKMLTRRIKITKSLRQSGSTSRRIPLATRKELSDFLATVERRAFKQALFAVRDDQFALDIVQDTMMKLADKYSTRPGTELPLLFQRILQNTIRDHFRRQKVRSMWTTQVSSLAEGDDHDPLETLEVQSGSNPQEAPSDQLHQSQILEIIEKALQKLPERQRQAFLLRYWEDMDVAEAAAAMGCSAGSVKTHCSRATHALALLLKDKGITL